MATVIFCFHGYHLFKFPWQLNSTSLSKKVSTQTKGDHTFSIHSDEGLSQIKKKQPAVALATVVLNHPGAWSGPWLNSEHLAAILGVLVGYAAISGKGKLLS